MVAKGGGCRGCALLELSHIRPGAGEYMRAIRREQAELIPEQNGARVHFDSVFDGFPVKLEATVWKRAGKAADSNHMNLLTEEEQTDGGRARRTRCLHYCHCGPTPPAAAWRARRRAVAPRRSRDR